MTNCKDISGLNDILREYTRDIQEKMENIAEQIGKECVSELKHNSPKRNNGGKYARSWTIDTGKVYNSDRGISEFRVIVHNKRAYQLTHLLEKPHLLRNGGISNPIVHIYPVEQKAIKQFEEKTIQIIGGIK